jgi:hypothetical protein
MQTWLTLWTVLLFACLGLFGVTAVVVAVGGFFDLRAMFRALKK